MLFFVDIPQVAGSRVWQAGIACFGAAHCHFDHGLGGSQTSPLAKWCTDAESDRHRVPCTRLDAPCGLLGGGEHANSDVSLSAAGSVVTFLRDAAQEGALPHFETQHCEHGDAGDLEVQPASANPWYGDTAQPRYQVPDDLVRVCVENTTPPICDVEVLAPRAVRAERPPSTP